MVNDEPTVMAARHGVFELWFEIFKFSETQNFFSDKRCSNSRWRRDSNERSQWREPITTLGWSQPIDTEAEHVGKFSNQNFNEQAYTIAQFL